MKTNNSRFYVKTTSTDDWRKLLADPDKHWKVGKSAYETANGWQHANGFPAKVKQVLTRSDYFKTMDFLFGFPEHQVPLDGGSTASQNDIWVLARCETGLVSIAVEGKEHETFGPLLNEWYDESKGKAKRMSQICNLLKIQVATDRELRYQLFHRTASAVIEAERIGATHAVMLVHTFFKDTNKDSFRDYANFLSLFGVVAERDQVVTTTSLVGLESNVHLHFTWVEGL